LRIEIAPILIKGADEFDTVFKNLNRRVDALLVAPQAFFGVHHKKLLALISAAKLPSIHERRTKPEGGALMSYGPNYAALLRKTASYVEKILKGAKPADLPVEQPTEYELVINMKTAKLLDLTFPESVIARADRVIQ
jgi:ABC-type uncharacterized transport system substrate-binding protein